MNTIILIIIAIALVVEAITGIWVICIKYNEKMVINTQALLTENIVDLKKEVKYWQDRSFNAEFQLSEIEKEHPGTVHMKAE